MRRDLFISLILHVAIVGGVYITGEIIPNKPLDLGEVIKVSMVSLPDTPPTQEPASNPLDIPKAVKADEQPLKLSDPKTKPLASIPKPKERPKPKKPVDRETAKGDADREGTAEGDSNVVKAPPGSPFAGATVDNASFNYPYWFDQAFYKIKTNWQNPVDADGAIICVIYFQVLKSGRVAESRVQRSSGIPDFDAACLSAVDRSSPFPPFPKEFSDEILGITIPFKYQPN